MVDFPLLTKVRDTALRVITFYKRGPVSQSCGGKATLGPTVKQNDKLAADHCLKSASINSIATSCMYSLFKEETSPSLLLQTKQVHFSPT